MSEIISCGEQPLSNSVVVAPKFKQGDKVYHYDGAEAKFIMATPKGVVVQVEYELHQGEESYWEEDVVIWDKVFPEPPIAKKNEEIVRQDKRLQEICDSIKEKNAELYKVQNEIHSAKRERERLVLALKQNAALARIEEFLSEKTPTHYVGSEYGEFIVENAKTERGVVRLLSLYGQSSREDLHWRINTYTDGSGSDKFCIPCFSKDEVLPAIGELMEKYFQLYKSGENKSWFYQRYLSAKQLGAKISPECEAAAIQNHVETLQSTINGANANIANDTARIQKMQQEIEELTNGK